MNAPSSGIDPVLSNDERDELRHLDYLSARTRDLLDRGLIPAEAYEAIVADGRLRRQAIERHGRHQAAIARARVLSRGRPDEALSWAELARELDPEQVEAWAMSIDLLWALEQDDEAIALCAEAVGHFPQLGHRLEALRAQLRERAEARRIRADREQKGREQSERIAAARLAVDDRRDDDAVDLCRQVLADSPDRLDALKLAAYALQRLGRLDEAIELYERLATLQPRDPVWSEWVRNLGIRRRFEGMVGKEPRSTPDGVWAEDRGDAAGPDDVDAPPPRWSWSSFAAEFLEEHWQKLILCLAVLLIVVSSTVGAHLLLGPLLWLPAGTCALALVWTLLFAALGAGLIRWGAARAGQMMLVATLIVVPIHFMLAGELKLVTRPSASGLIVAAVDGLALIGLVRAIAGMLGSRGQARFLTAALLLLSVGSVATARGSPVGWGWQFAAFQAPAVVMLGMVGCLGVRRWGESDEAHRRFAILMLGLLGFAFVACTIRIGVYALRLEPALYAVPVMLGAIATVAASRQLAPFDTDVRRIAGIRYAGFVLSGLSFALALTPPPTASALYSANTIAASLLGFGLYAAALRRDRHPAFLYLAIAALISARVGAHYFLAERIRLVIDALRRALGYDERLPWAYLSLVGLVANPALAALSFWFRGVWDDRRLARHCHYIGLPLAVVACLWSCQEPKAAAIVLSGYAALFAFAVWTFAVPWLTYLAIAATCGAAGFAATLRGGWSMVDLALVSVALAWVDLGIGRLLHRFGSREEYAVPWIRAARVLTPVALLLATAFIAVRGAQSTSAAAVFVLAGVLAWIATRERPRIVTAGLVLICFVEFTLCGLSLLTSGRPYAPGAYGLLLVGDGLVLLALAGWLSRRGRDGEIFLAVIPRFSIGLTLMADYIAFIDGSRTWVPGLVWLMGAPALLGATRRVRDTSLVYGAIAQLVAGVLALSHWSTGFADPGLAAAWVGVTAAALAIVLWLAGIEARRRGISSFYVVPCWNWSLGLTVAVLALEVWARMMSRDAYRFGVLALSLNAAATILLSASWRRFELTYAAVLHVVVATYLVLFSVGKNDPKMAYVLGLAAVVEAIAFWWGGFACERVLAGRIRPYAGPLFHATVALTMLGVVLSDRSAVVMALATAGFLLTVKSLPRTEWLYAAAGCLAAAVYFRWLIAMTPAGLMAAALMGAFVFWAVAVFVQEFRATLCDRLGLRPLAYESPIFHSSVAAGLIAMAIRLSLSLNAGAGWADYSWCPLALSMLALLMVKAYPRTECVHLSLAFLTFGVVSAASPSLTSLAAGTLAVMGLAMGLFLLDLLLRADEPAICHRLGVRGAGYVAVVRGWSGVLFAMAATGATAIVLGGMADAFGLLVAWDWGTRTVDWWVLLAALVLAAGYLTLAAADPESWVFVGPEGVLAGLHAIVVLWLWWLGVASSPLAGWLPPAADYYPIGTVIAALSAIHLGRRFTDPASWHELAWLGDVRSEAARRALAFQACFLAILAVLFTGGVISWTTAATMALGALALGLAGFMGGWTTAAGLASIAWTGACSVLGIRLARQLGLIADDQQATWAAWGAVASAFALWRWAGVLRAGGWAPKSTVMPEGAPAGSLLRRFARVVEGVASGSAVVASGLIVAMAVPGRPSATWVPFAGVAVLLAAALLHIAMVPRWRVEWPVYIAQCLMIGAYAVFRMAFPLSNAADAAVLTLLAYLDMGIAEALERLDRAGIYTRPTRYASLVLPLLPLLQLLGAGSLDDISLFYLAAAATFYATACGRLRWRSLGYAAAVFADAALWLVWSRMGWQLAEYPQLYLVPVGLSAILFAEVNRELGRPTVNAIRSVGLVVIYASLAMPIWRFESFGAWLTLLIASLAGVFLGIGLRLQTFLWLGLTTFVLDVVYEMGRVSLDYAMAKWAIMLALGLSLVLFVALNEKKRILSQMLHYYAHVRTWE